MNKPGYRIINRNAIRYENSKWIDIEAIPIEIRDALHKRNIRIELAYQFEKFIWIKERGFSGFIEIKIFN